MSHLGLNILSTIHGMSAIRDIRYYEVSLYFMFFLNSWRDWAFWVFSGRISQSFAPRFETVLLPYLHDLIILLSKQLFFLKSYEWSLSLKIYVIISGTAPLFTLNISFMNSDWIIFPLTTLNIQRKKHEMQNIWNI